MLLVARIVLGEFAHAQPHHQQAPVVESSTSVDCPDHATSTQNGQHAEELESDSQPADVSASAHGGVECCELTCDCACVHVTPVAGGFIDTPFALLNAAIIAGSSARPFGPILGGIFRPPA